jgi:hypothetical protein
VDKVGAFRFSKPEAGLKTTWTMTWCDKIKNHYETVWKVEGLPCPFSRGPINALPDSFQVLGFPPHRDRKMWTYGTCCMSSPEDTNPVELHMFSETESESVVELLNWQSQHRELGITVLSRQVIVVRFYLRSMQKESVGKHKRNNHRITQSEDLVTNE